MATRLSDESLITSSACLSQAFKTSTLNSDSENCLEGLHDCMVTTIFEEEFSDDYTFSNLLIF